MTLKVLGLFFVVKLLLNNIKIFNAKFNYYIPKLIIAIYLCIHENGPRETA